MPRYLALDLGEKRIGIAISDPTRTIAQPLKTLNFTGMKILIAELQKILNEFEVSRIIIGLPLTLKGTFSARTRQTMKMVEDLRKRIATPIETYDERLTTIQAHSSLHQMGKKPSRERNRVDQLAAVHLLQNYLDLELQGRRRDEQ